jgi:hypothetical protein
MERQWRAAGRSSYSARAQKKIVQDYSVTNMRMADKACMAYMRVYTQARERRHIKATAKTNLGLSFNYLKTKL